MGQFFRFLTFANLDLWLFFQLKTGTFTPFWFFYIFRFRSYEPVRDRRTDRQTDGRARRVMRSIGQPPSKIIYTHVLHFLFGESAVDPRQHFSRRRLIGSLIISQLDDVTTDDDVTSRFNQCVPATHLLASALFHRRPMSWSLVTAAWSPYRTHFVTHIDVIAGDDSISRFQFHRLLNLELFLAKKTFHGSINNRRSATCHSYSCWLN